MSAKRPWTSYFVEMSKPSAEDVRDSLWAYEGPLSEADAEIVVEQFQRGHGGQAGDVLHRGAGIAFVAPQQDIGAAIDQHHRIDVEVFDQVPVRGPYRLHVDATYANGLQKVVYDLVR